MGQRVPKYTMKSSQLAIDKLAVFLVSRNEDYAKSGIQNFKKSYDRSRERSKLLERPIIDMRKVVFPDASGSYIPDEFNEWSHIYLKEVNILLIDVFVSVRNQAI